MEWYWIIGIITSAYVLYVDRKTAKYEIVEVILQNLFLWPIMFTVVYFIDMVNGKMNDEFTFWGGFKTEKEAYPQRFI